MKKCDIILYYSKMRMGFAATLHLTASKLINSNIPLILFYIVLILFVVKDAYEIVKIAFFRSHIRLYSSICSLTTNSTIPKFECVRRKNFV